MSRASNRRTPPAAAPQLALSRAAASRPRCEPLEIEDPTNAALDLIEAQIREVLLAGGEHALRRRLERLLPVAEVVDGRATMGARPSSAAGGGSVSPPPVALVQNAREGDRHG